MTTLGRGGCARRSVQGGAARDSAAFAGRTVLTRILPDPVEMPGRLAFRKLLARRQMRTEVPFHGKPCYRTCLTLRAAWFTFSLTVTDFGAAWICRQAYRGRGKEKAKNHLCCK